MVTKTLLIELCFVMFVCADIVPLTHLTRKVHFNSAELPLASAYSSSVIQAVSNDGHGLSYSTVQTHNPVAPVLGAKLIQPVIRYNLGSFHLPLSNVGLFVQNPAFVNGLSGLVPVQQIEPDTIPGSSFGIQNSPILPAESLNSDDDSVSIEAN